MGVGQEKMGTSDLEITDFGIQILIKPRWTRSNSQAIRLTYLAMLVSWLMLNLIFFFYSYTLVSYVW
jgi:hypothetical protein